ncbi:VanZ family protein [Arthrobacter sp. YD2]|uniref:VanZ family protein n=1 Tax=Arthrobacter sp. YD2 TaxID=3058046 RepID=UPI0025B2AB08|nr:VanZ family protein [Arthrobacter sp. YD2]MDN3905248.1 VanZ family protein [Arthrobacter sp. YD2]
MAIPQPRRGRRLTFLFLFYAGALTLIVFWPSPVDAGSAGMIQHLLTGLHSAGVPGWVGYPLVEFAANVVLFVPFGVFAAARLPGRFAWLAAVAGVAASCSIETVQHFLLPARYATAQDILANTAGAALGALAVYVAQRRREAQTRRTAILPRS